MGKQKRGKRPARRPSVPKLAEQMNEDTTVGDDGYPDVVPQTSTLGTSDVPVEPTAPPASDKWPPDDMDITTSSPPLEVVQEPTAPAPVTDVGPIIAEVEEELEVEAALAREKLPSGGIITKPSYGHYIHRCRVVTDMPAPESFEVGRRAPDQGGVTRPERTPIKIVKCGSEIMITFEDGSVSRLVNVPVELQYAERPAD